MTLLDKWLVGGCAFAIGAGVAVYHVLNFLELRSDAQRAAQNAIRRAQASSRVSHTYRSPRDHS